MSGHNQLVFTLSMVATMAGKQTTTGLCSTSDALFPGLHPDFIS